MSDNKKVMFTVDTRTRFTDTYGNRIQRGDWKPTHFRYHTVGKTQWLIVGDKEMVEIGGEYVLLDPVPEGVNIKGMEYFDKPCVARYPHKRYI